MAKFLRLLVCLLVTLLCGPAFSDDCTEYAIQDSYLSDFSLYSFSQIQSAICQSTVQNLSDAQSTVRNVGISAAYSGAVFGLNYGGTDSTNHFNDWKSAFCASNYNAAQQQLHQGEIEEYLGPDAVAAIKACYNATGPQGTFLLDPQGNQFKFVFRTTGSERLYQATIEPSSAVSACNPSNPFKLGAGAAVFGNDISGHQEEVSCNWNGQPLHISMKLKNAGQLSYPLPALQQPATPSPTSPADADCPKPIAAPAAPTPEVIIRQSFAVPQQVEFGDLPADKTCTQVAAGDYWQGPGETQPAQCPSLNIYHGPKGQPGWAQTPGNLPAGHGVCAYALSCASDQ